MARRPEKSATLAQIRLEQQQDDLQVRAQSALIGERFVAITRLAVMMMIGLSTVVVAKFAETPPLESPLRSAIVALYVTFCIATVIATQVIKKGDPKLALWLVGSYIFVDASFFLFQAWNDHRMGAPVRPELVTASFALLICYSVARSRLIHVALSTAVSVVSVAVVAVMQGWAHPVWTGASCSCLLALGLLIGFTNFRSSAMFMDIRRRENLSRFLPRQVVQRVLASGGLSLEPVQREVTILFSDIRSFTSMSETMAPREVLEFLDEYFGHMGQIVRGHEGMLNKFLGDGMLAVWGVPDRQEDHPVRAVKAALDMRRKLVELNEHWVRSGRAEVRIYLSESDSALPPANVGRWFSTLWPHIKADRNGLRNQPDPTKPCRFICFEDFKTTGLTGSTSAHQVVDGAPNHFLNFFRAEGRWSSV